MNALIVDDNCTNTTVLSHLLLKQGIESIAQPDPGLVAQTLSSQKFDLVFLDLEMPGLSGYDVLKTLQTQPGFADVPVIACTVHISEIGRCREAGFSGFIAKPLNARRFPEQLAKILRGEEVWERQS